MTHWLREKAPFAYFLALWMGGQALATWVFPEAPALQLLVLLAGALAGCFLVIRLWHVDLERRQGWHRRSFHR